MLQNSHSPPYRISDIHHAAIKGPTLYMFPGQGEQHVGMARDIFDQYNAARAIFQWADDILAMPISKLCFDGPETELNETINSQPAVLTVSIAFLTALIQETLSTQTTDQTTAQSNMVAGHSLGEYTALVAAGALDFDDALRVVRKRGELMSEAGRRQPGMMAAVLGLDDEQILQICQDSTSPNAVVQIANYNCPGQVVISGHREAVEAAMNSCQKAKARKIVPLVVSVAAHSALMGSAVEELATAIDSLPVRQPQLPVIGNTAATPLQTPDEIKSELIGQLTGSVRWTDTIRYAIDQNVTSFVEFGPGNTLTSLVKRIERRSDRAALNTSDKIRSYGSTDSVDHAVSSG